jgi:hypothetical protein
MQEKHPSSKAKNPAINPPLLLVTILIEYDLFKKNTVLQRNKKATNPLFFHQVLTRIDGFNLYFWRDLNFPLCLFLRLSPERDPIS